MVWRSRFLGNCHPARHPREQFLSKQHSAPVVFSTAESPTGLHTCSLALATLNRYQGPAAPRIAENTVAVDMRDLATLPLEVRCPRHNQPWTWQVQSVELTLLVLI